MRRSANRGGWVLRAAAIAAAVSVLGLGGGTIALGAGARAQLFPSPEDAAKALVQAARTGDARAVLAVLGSDARNLISSGDPVVDRRALERFVQAYDAAHRLEPGAEGMVTLSVGQDDWPFPLPLVKEASGWRFDSTRGREEILDRRIGKNELDAIQVCLAYVDAQREYYRLNPSRGALQYAQKVASTQGKRDGLYWATRPGEPSSPLGPLIVRAQGEGYALGQPGAKPVPYHGYYYRVLRGQGKDAPGGAYDYVVRGQMIGGFALVAYPAQYGVSGVTTFIVNHDGVVYQKDLGRDTATIARAMTRFNPDASWQKAQATP